MIRYSWISVLNNKKSSFLAFFSLLAIFIATPITVSALFDIQTSIEENIQEHGRGSYDILIRPTGNQTVIENSLGKVEENYLNYGDGGISIDDWEDIRNLDNVEIAAPVASLGYFTGENKTLSLAYPSTSSFIEFDFISFDGVNEYLLPKEDSFFYMLEQENYLEGFDFYGETDSGFVGEGMKPEFTIPNTYHFTVGIDQEEEEKLTGIDLSALQNPVPTQLKMSTENLDFDKGISIIYLSDSFVSLKGEAKLTNLDWTNENTLELKNQLSLDESDAFFFSDQFSTMHEILSDVKNISPTETYEVPLYNFISPFYYDALSYEYDGTFSDELNYSSGITETPIFYNAKPINYEILDDQTLVVKRIGENLGVPTFREVERKGSSTLEFPSSKLENEDTFILYPVGSFTTEKYQESLGSSPLGIYQQAPSVTVEEDIILRETIAPGSFVSSPAHGIINLEDAEFIKGSSPIDAIRLKVAGITSYDDDAVQKIENVIGSISTIGNYDITVVAGASPSPVILDVEGIGKVEQSWTDLGAAASISNGWNTTNQLIAGLFIGISFLYILNSSLFRKNTKVEEQTLLSDLGWTKSNIDQFHLFESYLLILFSTIISAILFITLYYFNIVNLLTLIFFLLTVIITLGVTWVNISITRRISFKIYKGIQFKQIWTRNIIFYRNLVLISLIQIICTSTLMNFITTALYMTNQETGQTNLGTHVNSLVLLLVITVLIATLYLVITTIIESISSLLFIRIDEITTLKDIGWKEQRIRQEYLKEFLAWIIPSIILGMIINLIILYSVYTMSVNIIIVSISITLILAMTSIIISSVLVRKTLKSSNS